jgi:hypothetical protein
MISILPLLTFRLCVARLQQHHHIEHISFGWYDSPRLVGFYQDFLDSGSYTTKCSSLSSRESSHRELNGRHHDFFYHYGMPLHRWEITSFTHSTFTGLFRLAMRMPLFEVITLWSTWVSPTFLVGFILLNS